MSETKEQIEAQIAELQAKLEELKTGGFKVGDKVLIDGVVSAIEDSYSHPLKVKMSGGKYDYFRPYDLRHAEAYQEPVGYVNIYKDEMLGGYCFDSEALAKKHVCPNATLTAIPVYRTPQPAPDASKRIAELEGRIDKIKAEAKRWKQQSEMWEKRAKKSHKKWTQLYADNQDLRDMLRGKNERIKELERGFVEWSKFEREYPASPEESFVGAVVAPKGVKERLDDYFSGGVLESGEWESIRDQIVELPEPSVWAVSITRLGVPPTEGCGLEFQGHELDIAAALIKAALEVEK